MKDWNTADHTIANTEHGILHFTGDVPLVIADWEYTEAAPDSDGRVYASLLGWLANGGGTGRTNDPYTEPIEAGRAHLVRTELRGRQPLTDLDVHVTYHSVGQPYPNTWDHHGCQVTVSWMDRRINANGQPIPEDEIGSTEWTHPVTGQVFDLTEAYVPAGECYYDDPAHPYFTWQHFDRWSGGVPVLHPFWGDDKAPADGAKLLTEGEWVRVADAPKFSERRAAIAADA
ncbi:hypothetical protein GL263_14685 [Streptomyces durbertensis]|uniref:Uncharacterized protein n=1 Tax=Streptomyces durbertensis TaxID=2448886 RepID=A0ABR6EHJ2_9ACTN|nr:hypothetical protein [Streptomyces durbertensis]MBB1244803.1 hypothetical protein [Streptomyces durbertensis]